MEGLADGLLVYCRCFRMIIVKTRGLGSTSSSVHRVNHFVSQSSSSLTIEIEKPNLTRRKTAQHNTVRMKPNRYYKARKTTQVEENISCEEMRGKAVYSTAALC